MSVPPTNFRSVQVENFVPNTENYVCCAAFNGGQPCKNFICRRREHDKVSSNKFSKFWEMLIGTEPLPCRQPAASLFPFNTWFFSPIGLKSLRLFINIFTLHLPIFSTPTSPLYQCRDENCPRKTSHKQRCLLADTTAIKHERRWNTRAQSFSTFTLAFSPCWHVFEWVAIPGLRFFFVWLKV